MFCSNRNEFKKIKAMKIKQDEYLLKISKIEGLQPEAMQVKIIFYGLKYKVLEDSKSFYGKSLLDCLQQAGIKADITSFFDALDAAYTVEDLVQCTFLE